jgi:hypothetical protein
LWAKPEQTQLEDLSDAFFMGKLLVLPANVTNPLDDRELVEKYPPKFNCPCIFKSQNKLKRQIFYFNRE